MTISQLDSYRRNHGWVGGPIIKRRVSEEEIRDNEVENVLNRRLSAKMTGLAVTFDNDNGIIPGFVS